MKLPLSIQMNPVKRFLGLVLVGVGFSAMLASTSLKAFDPDAPDYGHSYITRSIAGQGYAGWGKSVPEFTATLVASSDDALRFSPEAIDQLVTGTLAPDFLQQSIGNFYTEDVPGETELHVGGLPITGEPFNAVAHCDDDKVGQCSLRIFNFTANTTPLPNAASLSALQKMQQESAVNMLFEGAKLLTRSDPPLSTFEEKQAYAYGIAARVKVGRALHTVQDFYAQVRT
jgi:hypothetical protein